MSYCLVCKEPISPFLPLGLMPIANGFLTPDNFKGEYFFDLEVGFCSSCLMVQLLEQPEPQRMFHENYAFYSSTSSHMARHFEKFARDVIDDYNIGKDSFVIEIGSNDGIMLKHFAKRGIGHLGVEPSENVARVARENSINTIPCFFSDMLETPRADVILAANVMCHISDIHSVFRGVKKLLKDDGVLIFEDPYLGDILTKTSYDQIYDEHAFYFSVMSVTNLAFMHDMEIIDVAPQTTHGGSMRYTLANKGKRIRNNRADIFLLEEYEIKLDELETYETFAMEVAESKVDLVALLTKIKMEGGNIVGYGATSKSATITNYCGLGPELIDYICDTTPIKHWKFSPGTHIPVRPYDYFKSNPPTHALLFAWNHAKEIMEKEKDFRGKWIVYVPEVKIL